MKITEALLSEHRAISPLLDYIEATKEGSSIVQAAFLRSTLLSHADLEDTLLKPVILAHLPKSSGVPTDREAIAAKLDEVQITSSETVARDLLLGAIEDIRKHFHKEETLIFPLAERNLTTEQQERLGK